MASDRKERSLFPIQQHGSHTAALLTTAGFTTYRPPESTNAGGDRRLKAEQLEDYFQTSSEDDSSSSSGREGDSAAGPGTAGERSRPDGVSGRTSEKGHRKDKRHRSDNDRRSLLGKESRSSRSKRRKKHTHDADKVRALEQRHRDSVDIGERYNQDAWVGTRSSDPTGSGREPFFFDSHGDKDNLAFDTLYRGETPVYRRCDVWRSGKMLDKGVRKHAHPPKQWRIDDNTTGSWQVNDKKSVRYFTASQARLERDSGAARTRFSIPHPVHLAGETSGKLILPLPSVMPLKTDEDGGDDATPASVVESVEEYVLRRTREFNEDVRNEPWNLHLWLEYTAFQDQAAALRQTRKLHLAQVGVAEKKLSILEKALQHIPSSEKLLLAFMDAMSIMATKPQLLTRWQRLLSQHRAMPGLWDRYLLLQRQSFSEFRLAGLHQCFSQAIQALAGQAARCRREGAPMEEILKVEQARVDYVLQAIQSYMQSGHTERAVAIIQAILEFTVFAPPFPPSLGTDSAIRREFAAFWESGAPRIGDSGGHGWNAWMVECQQKEFGGSNADEKEQVAGCGKKGEGVENRVEEEGAGGGWSTWRDLTPAELALSKEGEQDDVGNGGEISSDEDDAKHVGQDDLASEDEQQVADGEGQSVEETEEELMAKLGMKLEAGLGALGDGAALGPESLAKWVEEEVARSTRQWQPIRPKGSSGDDLGDEDVEDDELVRRVAVEDVEDFLFRLDSCLDVREQLVLGCCHLLGAPLGGCFSSNSRTAAHLAAAQDCLTKADCSAVHAAVPSGLIAREEDFTANPQADQKGDAWLLPPPLEWCSADNDPDKKGWIWRTESCEGNAWWEADRGRLDFLRRLLRALVLGPFSEQPNLSLAFFRLESTAEGDSGEQSRAVLSERRSNLVLWSSYALAEAEAGRVKSARKVYEVAMSMYDESRATAACLALGCADMELKVPADGKDSRRSQGARALAAFRPLVWLGSEGSWGSAITQEAVVAARRGFQRMIPEALATRDGMMDFNSAAVIASAALFEALAPRNEPEVPANDVNNGLSAGMAAAAAIYKATRDSTDAPTRLSSPHHEGLQARFGRLLSNPPPQASNAALVPALRVTPRTAKAALRTALADYPSSPALLCCWAALHWRMQHLSALRRSLAEAASAPGMPQQPLVWVLLMQAEARRPGGRHRVHSALESCLAANSPLRSCPVLWRIYIAHHMNAGQLEPARKVFLRAIHECPWSKAVWLDGFSWLRGHLSPREIGELLDICREKEVFLRTDIFEVLLAGMDDDDGNGGSMALNRNDGDLVLA